MSCQISNTVHRQSSLIKLPFPPVIKASDILDKRKPSKVKSKSPNAFIIYRMAFLDHLAHLNRNLKMTDVSKLVSQYWRNETEAVKNEYRKIAREVEIELNERRQKPEPYKIVWKNPKISKYHYRKHKQIQENKSQSNTKPKVKKTVSCD